jgi:TonB-linked SusC/RagA family outer membrane protein
MTGRKPVRSRLASFFVPALFLGGLALFCISPALAQSEAFAHAQSPQSETGSFDTLGEADGSLQALQHPISLHAEAVTLKNALRQIARRGEFGLSYSPSVVPEQKQVSLHLEGTVSDALRQLFADTDLKVLISPRKEIVVVKEGTRPSGEAGAGSTGDGTMARKAPTLGLTTASVQQTISGRVTDAQTGNPVPGANVVVPNTTVGTATDAEGRYSLEVPDEADSLRFTAIGYLNRTVPIDGRTTIDVRLTRDVQTLEEVVVVGYGTQRQAEVTGSVTSVSSADIENLSVSGFQDALQGQLAGIEVRQPSGEPGASPQVRVRGSNSITAGNGPLFVVDGLPITSNEQIQGGIARRRGSFQPPAQNPLATLSTQDIESIEVLKDASASAIYGSRGSNGVVIVTTKSGDPGNDMRVRYRGSVGLQEVINAPDMMNADELVDLTIESRNNAYREEFGEAPPNPRTNEGRPPASQGLAPFTRIPSRYVAYDQGEISTNTDWLDLVLGDRAGTWSSTISVSGGGGSTSYYLSGSARQQDGIVGNSAFDRYSLHASLDSDLTDRVRVGADLNLSLSQQDREPANAPYFGRPPGIVYSAMVHSPLIEPFNNRREPNQKANDPVSQSFLDGGTTSASNPLAIQNAVQEDLDHHRTFGTAFTEVDLGSGLTFKSLFGADLSDYTRSFYRGRELFYRILTDEPDPYAQSNSSRTFNWLSENTLRYGDTFDDVHTLDLLAGVTAQEERNDFNQIFARDFPIDAVPTLSGGRVTDGTSTASEWSLLSGLARANYDYDGKYLLTAALRADKSSRFGPDNRTGIFPSASVGWRVTEEDFMDAVPQFSTLKLRLSYGQTGNFQIPNYGSFSNLRFTNYVGGESQNVLTGVEPDDLGDPGLTWETTEEVNLGIDLGLFDDRVRLETDVYRSVTSDLLLNISVPAASGYETVLTNIGEVENTGLEVFLETQNLTGDFSWSSSVNFSTNKNEVTELGPEDAPILSRGAAGIRHITRVGDPIGSYYGYVVDGVYQSEEEIQNASEDQVTGPGGASPGDFRFKDINGDEEITSEDRTVTGSYQPDFTYGIANQFQYRGFDLRVFLQGVRGREILNLTARHLKNGEFNFNQYDAFLDRWQSPESPGSGDVPRVDRLTGLHGNNNRPSDFQVEDGSYLNVREVTFGYTAQGGFLSDLVQQFRVYATGQNLYMFTDYIGFNPMASLPTEDLLTQGQDYGAYPLQRTYTVGIDLRF